MSIATTRRGVLAGLVSLVAAPAIVQAANLMPVSGPVNPFRFHGDGIGDDHPWLQWEVNSAARLRRRFVLVRKHVRMSQDLVFPRDDVTLLDCVIRGGGLHFQSIPARVTGNIHLGDAPGAPGVPFHIAARGEWPASIGVRA